MPPALTFTIAEAITVLEPPLTETQLRSIVVALGWKPAAYRRTGRAGHPWPAYEAADILKLHAALVPFLRIERLLCAWVRAPAYGRRAFTMPRRYQWGDACPRG